MADYADDGRQEYIPAGRLGKQPLQRPLSAHHSHIRNPAPVGKQPAFGASASPNNGRRIQSALPYRNRPGTAGAAPHAALNAWGEPSAPAAVGSPRAYGGGAGGGLNLFAGMEPPPMPQRSENTRPIASREREALDEELRRLRVTLAGYKDQNRLLRTDRQRLEEELGRARTNLVKAEELLNAREKALSPTIGLSQMYRTPETTALVTKLKEQVRVLRAEKERFKGDLEELLRSTKATRVAELQSEAHALSQELARQMEMTAIMRNRMEDAEAMAAAAQRKAEAAEALAREYTDAGSAMPPAPARLAPGNTLSSGRVRKTMGALQQAHRALSSQATLLRAVFPPGLTMEQLAAKAALKAPTAGATEVLRFLRHHVNKLNTELNGLPGGRMDPDDGGEAAPTAQRSTASPPTMPRPPRGRPTRPMSAGPTGAAKAAAASAAGPAEPSSDPRVLLQGTADLVRQLRAMDMDSFMGQPDLEADVEQLADVSALLIAEHKRLTGAVSSPVFADGADGEEQDVSSRENPLYQPVPKADPDLVPDEEEEEEEEGGKKKGALAEEETYEDDFAADGYEEVGELDSPKPAAKKASSSGARSKTPEPAEEESAEEDAYEDDKYEEEEAEPEPEEEVEDEEPAPAKPSLLRESSSQRSSRSAPDTPQKKVEAPASSVGDPAEYGTGVRTSAAGSAYSGSTRGWQPEEEPVKEHHSEADSEAGDGADDEDLGAIAATAGVAAAADDEPEEYNFGNVGALDDDNPTYDMSFKKRASEEAPAAEEKEAEEEAPKEEAEEEAVPEPAPVVADVSQFEPTEEEVASPTARRGEEEAEAPAEAEEMAAEEEAEVAVDADDEDLGDIGNDLGLGAADEEEEEPVAAADPEPEAEEKEEKPWWDQPDPDPAPEEEPAAEEAPAAEEEPVPDPEPATAEEETEPAADPEPEAEPEPEPAHKEKLWWEQPDPEPAAEEEPAAADPEPEAEADPAPKEEEEAEEAAPKEKPWWEQPDPEPAAAEEEPAVAADPEPEPEPAPKEKPWWEQPDPEPAAEEEPAAAADPEPEPEAEPAPKEEEEEPAPKEKPWWEQPDPEPAAAEEEPAAAADPEPEAEPEPEPEPKEKPWWEQPYPETAAEEEPAAAADPEPEAEAEPAPKKEEEEPAPKEKPWWEQPDPEPAAAEEPAAAAAAVDDALDGEVDYGAVDEPEPEPEAQPTSKPADDEFEVDGGMDGLEGDIDMEAKAAPAAAEEAEEKLAVEEEPAPPAAWNRPKPLPPLGGRFGNAAPADDGF